MEWLTCIRKAIDYMDEHLEDNISAQDVAGDPEIALYKRRRLENLEVKKFDLKSLILNIVLSWIHHLI